MVRRRRDNNGNVLVLIIMITALIVVPLLLVFSQTGFYVMDRDRVQSAVDAAGLVAANDISRIIINDPTFGWVSLSNYPPIGKATRARDGEPLPVTGINTLIGTIRQNNLVANELANEKMRNLVEKDRSALELTIAELNVTIKEALGGNSDLNLFDIHGADVRPRKDAEEFLRANLPKNVRLESLKLTNGWLKSGGTTMIDIPQPEQFSQMSAEQSQAGKYKPFIDIPANHRSFTFAGLGPSSRLVNNSSFQPADGKHVNTIVKIECVVTRQNPYLPFFPVGNDAARMKCVAFCQPYTMPDVGPKGIMTLRFSGQPVAGLLSWSDFLRPGNFQDKQVTTFDAVGGDYPTDRGAVMAQSETIGGTADQFAEHLYYWLRNGHLQPKLGAVLEMVNAQFKPGPSEKYAYEFAKDGSVARRVLEKDPFPVGVVADSQSSTMIDTRIQGGLAPIIIFRDNVKNIGTDSGGKHGGQPLAGYPLNWCELRDYGGDEQIALALGKGKLGTQLTVNDPNAGSSEESHDLLNELFRKLDGKALALQPRRNFYSGGLALDIEIGGIRQFQPHVLDLPSKRKYWANRQI